MDEKLQNMKKGPMIMVMLLGAFFSLLNETLLTTALPQIMVHFSIDATQAQWLTTAFLLANGIMIPISAFIIGKFSTRQIFISAITVFGIGTAVAAFSNSFALLLVARIVQAMGSGVMMPLMMTVMLTMFPPHKRGAAMGMMGLVIGFAPAIGPTLSGFLIEHYNWRMLFYAVLPIAALTLILAIIFIKNVTDRTNPKVDIISILLSSFGFGGLLYGFSSASARGWGDEIVLSCMIGGFLIIGLFIWRQLRLENPLLEFRVFKHRDFSIGVAISALALVGLISAETILPMYIQTARGMSALDSGLMLLPGAIVMGIMSPISGLLFDKFGAKKVAVPGMVIVILTTLYFTQLQADTPMAMLTTVYAIRMIGISMGMMPVMTHAMNQLAPRMNAHGSAMANTMQQVSASIGTAILVTVMSQGAKHFEPVMSDYANLAPAQLKAAIQTDALISGYDASFMAATILSIGSCLLALFLKGKSAAKQPSLAEEEKRQIEFAKPVPAGESQ